tara:strand:- start:277 stop:519 length:243 start_codon:yes stop_codon:yes gene_type:complete
MSYKPKYDDKEMQQGIKNILNESNSLVDDLPKLKKILKEELGFDFNKRYDFIFKDKDAEYIWDKKLNKLRSTNENDSNKI